MEGEDPRAKPEAKALLARKNNGKGIFFLLFREFCDWIFGMVSALNCFYVYVFTSSVCETLVVVSV